MAKTNKITQVKPNRARSERPDPQRLSKLFNLKRPGGNPSPTNPPFSKTNQPKKRGRPPGVQNLFTREIKEAAVNAATRYGVDGTGLGGLEGFFFHPLITGSPVIGAPRLPEHSVWAAWTAILILTLGATRCFPARSKCCRLAAGSRPSVGWAITC